jgi:hypothetical protein
MVSGPSSAVWYFITPHSELGTDTSFQAQTDFNGDGFADVVYLETQLLSSGVPGYIYHGGLLGLCYRAQSRWYVADRASTVGGDPYDSSIYEITGSGDINGDGFGDLISSTSASRSPRGFLTVHYGSPAGLDVVAVPSRLMSVSSPANAYGFGTRVRIIGDVNQDGYADVAVSATSVGGITNSGGVFVYFGSAAGLATTPAITILGATGEVLGVDIAGGGADFDGDGYHDLAMARRGTRPGIVIRRGTPSGLAAMDEDVTRNVTGSLATLTSLSAADINGDGLSDLAYLTAIDSQTAGSGGIAAVFAGDRMTTLAMTAGWTRASPAGWVFIGAIRAADSTGDDAAEVLLVERTGTAPNFVFSPRIFLATRGPDIMLTQSNAAIGLSASGGAGNYVAAPGDINRDGRNDFALQAPFVQAYGYSGFTLLMGGDGGWSAGISTPIPVPVGMLGRPLRGKVFE